MEVKVVTDSTADLPPEIIKELGITVVPAFVCFGQEVHRDRVDINEDDFYRRLLRESTHPSTMPPTPQDFAEAYQSLSTDSKGIISIHVSSRLSETFKAALQAAKIVENACPIEVVDSRTTSMALGLAVIAAATSARSGKNLQQIVKSVEEAISSIRLLALFDTLEYLAKGGRIGRVKALLGSVLRIKPMLTIKDGELVQVGKVHSRSKGIERMVEFARNAGNIEDLAIIHSTTHYEAEVLASHIGSVLPTVKCRITRLGPSLGVHGGPRVLAVALRNKEART